MPRYIPFLVFLLLLACDRVKLESEVQQTESDAKDPIELTIEEEGVQSRDHICLKATVRNKSTQTIGWDREFSVFLKWELVPDDSEDVLESKTIVAKIEQMKENLSK